MSVEHNFQWKNIGHLSALISQDTCRIFFGQSHFGVKSAAEIESFGQRRFSHFFVFGFTVHIFKMQAFRRQKQDLTAEY